MSRRPISLEGRLSRLEEKAKASRSDKWIVVEQDREDASIFKDRAGKVWTEEEMESYDGTVLKIVRTQAKQTDALEDHDN